MNRLLFAAMFLAAIPGNNVGAQTFHTAMAPSPQPGTVFIYPERIPLQAGGMFTARRGLMFVPLNRSDPDSDVIAVEFYQFRSRNPNSNVPPIFMLQGGPGFEGLESVLKHLGTFERQFHGLRGVADVVVVGQRGIGSSKPSTLIELKKPQRRLDQPFDEESWTNSFAASLSREKQFWVDQGVDLGGYTVLEAAGDVHDICRALGYEKLIAMGNSFGSHWAMAIMREYPNVVARAVLAGLEGPDQTWDHPGWIWNAFKRVADDAENDAELAKLIPDGGLIRAIESMVRKADAEPFTVVLNQGTQEERRVLIDGHAMRSLARGYSGNLKARPADVIRMGRGDFADAAKTIVARSSPRDRVFQTASKFLLNCASGASARKQSEFGSDAALHIIGDPNLSIATATQIWDVDLGDDFREEFHTDVPTILIHGTWDEITPYENAVELKSSFSNGHLVTVKRGSHNAMPEAFAANRHFARGVFKFMLTGDVSGLPRAVELPPAQWVIPE